jgi:hypothetical protein
MAKRNPVPAAEPVTETTPVVEETTAEETETTVVVPSAELLAVVDEINTVFGMDPCIASDTVEGLMFQLGEAGKDAVIADKKTLSATTWAFLRDNKMINHIEESAPPAAKPEKAEKPPKVVKEKDPNAPKREAPPREKRLSWPAGTALKPAHVGTKVASALDFIASKKLVNVNFAELATANGWSSASLAKAYVTDNIVKMGYGVTINADDTFNLVLPAKITIPAHVAKGA